LLERCVKRVHLVRAKLRFLHVAHDANDLIPWALIAAAVANALADWISMWKGPLRERLADHDLVDWRVVHVIAVEQAPAHKGDLHRCEVRGRHGITERARLFRTRYTIDLSAVLIVFGVFAAQGQLA